MVDQMLSLVPSSITVIQPSPIAWNVFYRHVQAVDIRPSPCLSLSFLGLEMRLDKPSGQGLFAAAKWYSNTGISTTFSFLSPPCLLPPPCPLPPPPQGNPPDLEWFPRLRCMSLQTPDDVETEQNEMKEIKDQLASNSSLVKGLSQQLEDLRDKVI